jgi:hypothetical protein
MNAQLNHLVAQQRIADLHRAAERARVTTSAGAGPSNSRVSHPVTRLKAELALIARLAPTRLSGANHTARTPLAPDPVFDIGTPAGTSRTDVP